MIWLQFRGGATPITPKKGCSGSSRPQGVRAILLSTSSGMLTRRAVAKSSGSAPISGTMRLYPPILAKRDVEDANLKRLPRPRAHDGDRSGQNMAGSHALASLVNLLELRGHVKACGREVIRGAVVLLGYRADKSASNQPAP